MHTYPASAQLFHFNSKAKQGGCTRKGYAVRFPMLRIDRDAK